MRRRLAVLLVLAISAAAAAGARARLEPLGGRSRPEQELLYLPNGRHLKMMSLGNGPLVADALYLWAIQYYSDYTRRDRYRYVEHVFGNVIAELDPHYVDPYWLGAMILSVEAHDLDGALRLLDKGFAANPDQWILPYLAGWECERAHRYLEAAAYFRKASGVKGAPSLVARMRAGMYARAGNLRLALALWREVRDDPRSDAAARAIASRQIRDLRVRLDLVELRRAVKAFRGRTGRNPRALSELVAGGLIARVPTDPDGKPYVYDRETGRVGSTAGRVLGKQR